MVLILLRLGVLAADLLPPQCPNEFLLVKVGGGLREWPKADDDGVESPGPGDTSPSRLAVG